MANNTSQVRVGFTDMDKLIVNDVEIDLAYLGDNIIWGEVTPPVTDDETILDTFTITGAGGPTWRSANSWWNGWHTSGGTWSSTGTLTGDYITIDSGSQLRTNAFRLGPVASTVLPANAQVRVTFTPSAADSGTSLVGAAIGSDETFYWNDGPFTDAEIEEGGTFGWNSADDIKIEIFTVLGVLLIQGATSGTNTGGVESNITGGTVTGIPGVTALNKMQFRDSVKNGVWTDDGFGLLWTFNDTTESAAARAKMPGNGTFTVCEAGTENVIFTYTYDAVSTFTGAVDEYERVAANCFDGTVPANNTAVDVYYH